MPVKIKYFLILAANRKVADLETKIEKIKEEKREQNNGELLITIKLYSIPKECCTYMNNECQLTLLTFWF